ncbi:MAG: galactofuranosyltransferase [Muribaculaceae bacterium]|nr:galactofuranosyltransferase [Muribaculaceae bacterium]
MNCYISKNYRNLGNAGDKAKTDIEAVMDRQGFVNIGLPQGRSKNTVKAYFTTLLSVLKGVAALKKDDIVVLQYPLKKYYDFVVSRAVNKGAKVITVIHDLGSFRRKKLTVEQEVARLNRSSVVIVHSPSMLKWLRDHGVTTKMVVLGLFDYLSDSQAVERADEPSARPGLMFAGNVGPVANGWIYELANDAPDVDLVLYGGGMDHSRKTANMVEKGFVDSDTLIATAEGDYGVVWYGDSLDEGAGPLGDYLQYNAPHKTSLYLRAGIPVIIWEKAALAQIVSELGVGIAVPSLRGITERLKEITPEEYARMRRNAAEVAQRLADGEFIAEALRKAIGMAR